MSTCDNCRHHVEPRDDQWCATRREPGFRWGCPAAADDHHRVNGRLYPEAPR